MRVLVTGHRGFVGRHLWAALDTPDNDLYGIDVKGCTNGGWPEDGMDCRRFFRDHLNGGDPFDLVLHCAAIVGGRHTIDNEPMAVATDLAIDSDMFQWALRTRPGRVVYFSSSAAYPTRLQNGVNHRGRLAEYDIELDQIDQPDAIYGWVKLTGEQLARHARREGLNVTVVRPFSGYGPDQDLTYPFPSFIHRAATRADPFEVWGNGRQVRDWIHIDDVVAATLALAAAGVDGPVNLCTGRGVSMNDLVSMVLAGAGHSALIAHRMSAPVGVQYRVGDPSVLHRWYTPRVSLEEGVAEALAVVGSRV